MSRLVVKSNQATVASLWHLQSFLNIYIVEQSAVPLQAVVYQRCVRTVGKHKERHAMNGNLKYIPIKTT